MENKTETSWSSTKWALWKMWSSTWFANTIDAIMHDYERQLHSTTQSHFSKSRPFFNNIKLESNEYILRQRHQKYLDAWRNAFPLNPTFRRRIDISTHDPDSISPTLSSTQIVTVRHAGHCRQPWRWSQHFIVEGLVQSRWPLTQDGS